MRHLNGSLVLAAALLVSACVTTSPPQSAVGDYLSARLAARENEVADAAAAFTAAQRLAPGAPEILRDAFFFQVLAGNIDEALPLARNLLTDKNELIAEREAREETRPSAEASDDDDAELQDELRPEQLDDGLAALTLAVGAMKNDNYKKVATLLPDEALTDQALVAQHLQPIARILRAWALAEQSREKEAIALLRETPPETFRGFNPLHVALIADRAGLIDEARSAHQLSVMSLGGPVGRSAYGAFLERSGETEEARNYYELLANERGPSREAARQALRRLDKGRASTAYNETSAKQGSAIALYSLGAAVLEQVAGQREQALAAGFNVGEQNYNMPLALVQLALYLDPDLDEALRFAGSIINVQGDYDQATELLSRIDKSSPYWEQAQIDIASGYVVRDQHKKAERVLKKAARHESGGFEARMALANLYARDDKDQASVNVLSKIIDELPQDPESDAWRFYISRAESLLALDRWPEAEADLKHSVELAPEEATTLNYLGYSWAERGENLDEAFELIEKAVALQPSSGAIIDSLGWAHYQRGNYSEAVGHLEQAAQIEAGDPTITDHLGDVYWRLGRRVEARFQWERVLELEPDDKLRRAVEAKLENGLAETNAE